MEKDSNKILLDKTKKMFLLEINEKLGKNFLAFLNYYLSPSEDDKFNMENFFHSTKGMASMFGLEQLEKDSYKAEKYISALDISKLSAEDVFLIFEYYTKVWNHIDLLNKENINFDTNNINDNSNNMLVDAPNTNDDYEHDSLTEVYTKEYFYKNFKKEILSISTNNQILYSLALIDIDNFRTINRDNGYLAGDIILIEFCKIIENNHPGSDIYRFKGDKFIIVFKNIDSPDVYYNLTQLLKTVSNHKFKAINAPLSFSSAIYTIKNPNENLENTIEILFERLEKSKKVNIDKITILEPSRNQKRPKILIIEDLSVTVYLIKKHLEKLNCDILFASDGIEGLNKCIEEKPDIVLLDLMLPKMDGFLVCKKIKDNPEIKDTKIIILSSKNSKNDIMKCYNMGVDDFISKPFSMSILEKRIKDLF